MLKEIGSYTYDWWESIFLPKGETKNRILNGWFDLITLKPPEPLGVLKQRVMKWFTKENVDKVEFFKTLSQKEKDYIIENYTKYTHESVDDMQLFAVLSGHKPTWYCEHGFRGNVDFSKIKLNPKIGDKYDVVNLTDGQLYFLNKQEVMKIIQENKDFYCAAQKLNPSENTETIYKTLLKEIERASSDARDSLFGMTLGFPRHSSMIFLLNSMIENGNELCDKNFPLFKEKLLELLHSDKSPFRGYPKETITRLEEHIKTMQTRDGIKTSILYCGTYGNEEKAAQRIIKQGKDFDENFKIEDLM